MLNVCRVVLGLWMVLGGVIWVPGQSRPASRPPANPDWYDYERVGRRPTINGRPAREKCTPTRSGPGQFFPTAR